jgi:hypothetical protein
MYLKGRLAILGLLSALTLGLPRLAVAAPGSPTTAGAEHRTEATPSVPQGPSRASRGEEDLYAAREAASPQAKKYRGGDVIVISTTVLVIVLLIVVIIVLI